nr:LOW QUALITY PROTEIN: alanine and arginine-rich domain-containing protein [Camelus dromedarius]
MPGRGLGKWSVSEWQSSSRVPLGWGPAGSLVTPPRPAPVLILALGNKRSAIHAWKPGAPRLRDGPGGLPPPQRGNFLGPPQHPSQSWTLALNPASRARLPWGQPGRGRPEGGPRRRAAAVGPLLEDLRRRLVRAFQRAVPRGGLRRSAGGGGAAAAREEQSGARVESALAGLRAELLEMHFQNHQLARTLLDLDMKMQQLKKEYELEIASEPQSSEDNAVNPE